ncbi:hypothetical protein DSO57_1034527 [Entomophthora muscae]|uniref:Uncharacterized protein n=1 Tax=Entomophthora muscae TaxID=34485 RepID=A0ACC2RQN2_9FUNG|nr:hypothetical protein DSO57_1034527 [Entomophthora muscae]
MSLNLLSQLLLKNPLIAREATKTPIEASNSLEPVRHTCVKNLTKQSSTDMETKSDSVTHDAPISVGLITESIIETYKLDINIDLSTIDTTEEECLDSSTISEPIEDSTEVQVQVEPKEEPVQEVISDQIRYEPAPGTLTESSANDKNSITTDTVSEPVTPTETTPEVNSEQPKYIAVHTADTYTTDGQDPNADLTYSKLPSKAKGYKKMLKGTLQMSIGSIFRRRSLKARGKENKIDGKLEVEVAHASGNFRSSSEQ